MISRREDRSKFVEAATRRFREELTARVRAHERAGNSIHRVLGEPEAYATRAVASSVPEPSPWNELVGPFTRTEGAMARLGGITRQAVASKAKRSRLLRLATSDGVYVFPVWQFVGGGVLEGLPEILPLFDAVDGWTVAGWLRSVEPELGEAPADALLRGEVERVLRVARAASRMLSG